MQPVGLVPVMVYPTTPLRDGAFAVTVEPEEEDNPVEGNQTYFIAPPPVKEVEVPEHIVLFGDTDTTMGVMHKQAI